MITATFHAKIGCKKIKKIKKYDYRIISCENRLEMTEKERK